MTELNSGAVGDASVAQLRTFCEVCRRGGFAAAARHLLLTPPAVWAQMRALERHYGRPLLDRQGGHIVPTADGKYLLELIRPVLAALESTRELLHQQGGAVPSVLKLATNLRVLTEEISSGLRRFQKRFPQIRLNVIYTGNDVEQLVLNRAVDVGLTLEPGADAVRAPTATYELAGAVDYLLVTPRRHPLLRERSLHLRHVVRHPLILGEPVAYSRRRVQEILHRYDLTSALHVAVETSSDEYTLSCVRAGMGVGITIGTGRGHLYRELGVRSLRQWFGTARVGFLWESGAHVAPIQRALANDLATALFKTK
jgi:DNA-binding transcriptional LysR family regulator